MNPKAVTIPVCVCLCVWVGGWGVCMWGWGVGCLTYAEFSVDDHSSESYRLVQYFIDLIVAQFFVNQFSQVQRVKLVFWHF